MQIHNYSCNDEIDRKSCVLNWDEESNTYKIGKHKVPSLDYIVCSLLGIYQEKKEQKHNYLFSLKHFLMTGKKVYEENLSFFEPFYESDKPHAYPKVFNTLIGANGYYKETTDIKIIKNYNYVDYSYLITCLLNDNYETIDSYILMLENELNHKLGNKHYLLELENLVKYFYKVELEHSFRLYNEKDSKKELEQVQTKEPKTESQIAWFADFEQVACFHYHLAKKAKHNENLFYAGIVDIAAKDTLYFLSFNNEYSFEYAMLYLNILNIDYQKEKLKLLYFTLIGTITEVEIPKIESDIMDEIIIAYKCGKLINKALLPTINEKENPKIFYSYTSLEYIKNEILLLLRVYNITKLSFLIEKLLFSINNINPLLSQKEQKKLICELLKFSLTLIENIINMTDVQTALLFVNKLQDVFRNKEIFVCLNYVKDLLKNKTNLLTELDNINTEVSTLGDVIKTEARILNQKHIQLATYSDVNLRLKLTKNQSVALEKYLQNNLHYIADNKEDKQALNQIVNMSVQKKQKTLSGKDNVLSNLYRKNTHYQGCTRARKYLDVVIKNVEVCYFDVSNDEQLPLNIKSYKAKDPVPCDYYYIMVQTLDQQTSEYYDFCFTVYKIEDDMQILPEEKEKIKEMIEDNNKKLTLFFDTFSIKRGNFDIETWKEKTAKIAIFEQANAERDFLLEDGKGVLCFIESY